MKMKEKQLPREAREAFRRSELTHSEYGSLRSERPSICFTSTQTKLRMEEPK